jgi:heparosan-N-sulfate-glucuronate 5-epimerase
MRYRLTSWSFAIGLIVGSLSIISYNFVSNNGQSICGTSDSCTSNIRPIKCWIEGRRKLNCLKDESEVYLPFNKFIKKQFEVYGRVVDSNASNVHFEYYTSYSKSKRPDIRNYTSFGVFGNFGSFNVEKRERVKCMNGVTGLPMSNQWDDTPYYYPVQIAQFGLQHYSKLLTGFYTHHYFIDILFE